MDVHAQVVAHVVRACLLRPLQSLPMSRFPFPHKKGEMKAHCPQEILWEALRGQVELVQGAADESEHPGVEVGEAQRPLLARHPKQLPVDLVQSLGQAHCRIPAHLRPSSEITLVWRLKDEGRRTRHCGGEPRCG